MRTATLNSFISNTHLYSIFDSMRCLRISAENRNFRFPNKTQVRTFKFVHGRYVHEPTPIEPHPLGPPKNWKKSFMVFQIPKNTAPFAASLTYPWLTKTVELPKEEESPGWLFAGDGDGIAALAEEMEGRVRHVVSSHEHLIKLHTQRTDAHFMGLLTNLILYMTASNKYPHLQECCAAKDLEFELFWNRSGNKLVSKSQIDYVLRTKHPLPVFSEPVQVTDPSVLEQNYDPHDLIFFPRGFSVLFNYGGFRVENQTLPHVHTLFCYRPTAKSEEYLKMYGLTVLFSQSLAQARQAGLRGDAPLLPRPVVTQGVFINSNHAVFLRFQLNTLDYSSETAYYNWLQSSAYTPIFTKESAGQENQVSHEFIHHLVSVLSSQTDTSVADVHEINSQVSLPKPEAFIPKYPRTRKYKNNVFTYRKQRGIPLRGKLTGDPRAKIIPD